MCAFDVVRWDGKPIDKPGLYAGIPIELYHGDLCVGPSISSSGLRTIFAKSPAHYYDTSYLNPNREEQEDSDAFILGRATHFLLLGEQDFSKYFAIQPAELNGKAWHGNRNDCKDWLAAMGQDHLTVLTQNMVKAIRGMSKSLAANPLINAGILNGLVEHSLIWRDEETGVWLKSRPDCLPEDSADTADLKTTADVSGNALIKSIGGYSYHVQGALVGMGFREVLKVEMSSFSLVFVESKRPHCTDIVTLKECDLELGEQQIRAALRRFRRSLDTGEWPGPAGHQRDAHYVELNPYVRRDIEFRLEQMAAEEQVA